MPRKISTLYFFSVTRRAPETSPSEINFKLTIFKPLKFKENDSLEKISQNLNSWLEETIQNSPKKWIWSHDRWK